MSNYGYFAGWHLPPYDHPVEWVKTKVEGLVDFRVKATLPPSFNWEFSQIWKMNIRLGQESIIAKSPVSTLLHDMIGDDPKAMFPYQVDFRHFTTVSRDTRFTYWLCNYLNYFERILKKAGIYKAIWDSCYRQQIGEELLKAHVARWSPSANTFPTCYRELSSPYGMFIKSRGCP